MEKYATQLNALHSEYNINKPYVDELKKDILHYDATFEHLQQIFKTLNTQSKPSDEHSSSPHTSK